MKLLERHPEAFDSFDVLDDLATATMTHGQSGQPAVIDRLSRPLLERSVAILERALADARPAPARVRWAMTENRPALRSLFRLHEIAMQTGRDGDARRLAEHLIAINPDDNHGVRCWLAGAYLKADDADACLRLVEAYPDDASPELRFDAALALYRLGRARSATEALQSAHREMPRVTRYLLEKRIARPKLSEHGVSFDGDDRGWLYREDHAQHLGCDARRPQMGDEGAAALAQRRRRSPMVFRGWRVELFTKNFRSFGSCLLESCASDAGAAKE